MDEYERRRQRLPEAARHASAPEKSGKHLDITDPRNARSKEAQGGKAANEFESLGIHTPDELEQHLSEVGNRDNTKTFTQSDGSIVYYNNETNTYFVDNANSPADSTAFRPSDHKSGYDNSEIGEEYFSKCHADSAATNERQGLPPPQVHTMGDLREMNQARQNPDGERTTAQPQSDRATAESEKQPNQTTHRLGQDGTTQRQDSAVQQPQSYQGDDRASQGRSSSSERQTSDTEEIGQNGLNRSRSTESTTPQNSDETERLEAKQSFQQGDNRAAPQRAASPQQQTSPGGDQRRSTETPKAQNPGETERMETRQSFQHGDKRNGPDSSASPQQGNSPSEEPGQSKLQPSQSSEPGTPHNADETERLEAKQSFQQDDKRNAPDSSPSPRQEHSATEEHGQSAPDQSQSSEPEAPQNADEAERLEAKQSFQKGDGRTDEGASPSPEPQTPSTGESSQPSPEPSQSAPAPAAGRDDR